MDGLLLNSEPFWKETELKIFHEIGVPLTSELCDTTVGMRVEEVVKHWSEIYPWDMSKTGNSVKEISSAAIDGVIKLINEKGIPFDGVNYIIDFFKKRNIKTAIASSSAMSIIEAVLNKFELKDKFDAVHSAEFEELGKPHPAVYLNTAKQLDVLPQYCLAFEDSYNGLIAARDAGMKTVAIPEKRYLNDPRFDIADVKLKNLNQFNEEIFHKLNS